VNAFKENALKYEKTENKKKNRRTSVETKSTKKIIVPHRDLKVYLNQNFNYNMTCISRKTASTNVVKSADKEEIQENSKESLEKIFQSPVLITKENFFNKSPQQITKDNFAEFEFKETIETNELKLQDNNIEFICYKAREDYSLAKYKLICIGKNLFYYKYLEREKEYILSGIHHLTNYSYVTVLPETKTKNNIFYTIQFVFNLGRIRNTKGIYFFKSQDEMKRCVEYSKTVLNLNNIDKHYEQLNILGKGQFGKVKLGKNKTTGQFTAIKNNIQRKI